MSRKTERPLAGSHVSPRPRSRRNSSFEPRTRQRKEPQTTQARGFRFILLPRECIYNNLDDMVYLWNLLSRQGVSCEGAEADIAKFQFLGGSKVSRRFRFFFFSWNLRGILIATITHSPSWKLEPSSSTGVALCKTERPYFEARRLTRIADLWISAIYCYARYLESRITGSIIPLNRSQAGRWQLFFFFFFDPRSGSYFYVCVYIV